MNKITHIANELAHIKSTYTVDTLSVSVSARARVCVCVCGVCV